MTPATTPFARICIRPVLSPFLYFPYAGLTTLLYPILGYHSLLYKQLISFLVSLDYGSYDPFVPPSATRQRHHNNTDAMNCLEWILGLHIGSDLGRKTWEQVCKSDPGKMKLIVRDAMNAPELAVFAQAAGQWAIQMLISNKMNSRIRYNRCEEEQQEKEVSLAPKMVPDLATNSIAPSQSNFVGVNEKNPPHNEIQKFFDEIEENPIHGYVGNCNGGSPSVQRMARTANNLRGEVVRPVRHNASAVPHPQPAASAINQDFSASIRGSGTRSRGMRRVITRAGRVRGATGRVTRSTGRGARRRAS